MSGIVFFRTKKLDEVKRFYQEELDWGLWQDQGDCAILRHGNLLAGFHATGDSEIAGLITLFYPDRDTVDRMYTRLQSRAESAPSADAHCGIYHFFARDPENRRLEIQSFDDPVDAYLTGQELLASRRSIRKFKRKAIPQDVIDELIEVSRWAPTAYNSQPCYFRIIREKQTISDLSYVKGRSSEPLRGAPMAVAVCADPGMSMHYQQDGCITAYHFMLAAWYRGLGSCWIGAMDSKSVKKLLKVPQDHFIATVMPLGYPSKLPGQPPERKDASWYLR